MSSFHASAPGENSHPDVTRLPLNSTNDTSSDFTPSPSIDKTPTEQSRTKFNVKSPSFVPLMPSTVNSISHSTIKLSPKVATAAVFTPRSGRSSLTSSISMRETAQEWKLHGFPDFIPQGYDGNLSDNVGSNPVIASYDPFSVLSTTMTALSDPIHQSLAHYTSNGSSMNATSATYYPGPSPYAQPTQYHLYAPIGPHRENLAPYQRTAHDFFMSNNLREELQRKCEATHQVLPNSALPARVDHLHSLVPLDVNHHRNPGLLGYQSWMYKATSSKDGRMYCLRRLEGYRLLNEKAIRAAQSWKRINCGSVVTIHDAFTSRAFGDNSLIFVTDYHPLSKTLAEEHFNMGNRYTSGRFPPSGPIPEQTLWSYIVQIATALRAIHSHGLAAQVIHLSKIILTSTNRIRLACCGVFDVLHFESDRSLTDLQSDDLTNFGLVMLCLAVNNVNASHNPPKALANFPRIYSESLKKCIVWLLTPSSNSLTDGLSSNVNEGQNRPKEINAFLSTISTQMSSCIDNLLHAEDTLISSLTCELENGRLFRLLAKLNFINERPEFAHDARWCETGERYYLKLFRDYIFHQVDAVGRPVVDLGHVVTCLNKLDAGIEEKVSLISRDEQSVLVVSYNELKRAIESAFTDLLKNGRRS